MNELQRFPVLRKRMDEVIGDFLREGLEPSEAMIGDIIDMEVCIMNWKSLLSLPSFTQEYFFSWVSVLCIRNLDWYFLMLVNKEPFLILSSDFLVLIDYCILSCELNY